MTCPTCKNEMHIVSQFFETQESAAGGTDIYSIVDLMCTDPQCRDGKRKMPTARRARLVKTAPSSQNGVYCCGRPLVYIGEGGYWLPGGAQASREKYVLTVRCANCGQTHTANVGGGQEVFGDTAQDA